MGLSNATCKPAVSHADYIPRRKVYKVLLGFGCINLLVSLVTGFTCKGRLKGRRIGGRQAKLRHRAVEMLGWAGFGVGQRATLARPSSGPPTPSPKAPTASPVVLELLCNLD